jgi:hypothetical protein
MSGKSAKKIRKEMKLLFEGMMYRIVDEPFKTRFKWAFGILFKRNPYINEKVERK